MTIPGPVVEIVPGPVQPAGSFPLPPPVRKHHPALAAGVGLSFILLIPVWLPLLVVGSSLFGVAYFVYGIAKRTFFRLAALGNWLLDGAPRP